jgi:hypothetical protein
MGRWPISRWNMERPPIQSNEIVKRLWAIHFIGWHKHIISTLTFLSLWKYAFTLVWPKEIFGQIFKIILRYQMGYFIKITC